MSPRSDELLAGAREWLATAEAVLQSGFAGAAVAEAYYAVLYAARAALSEEDRHAKSHHGTWALFGELFVRTGRFDRRPYRDARRLEERRADAHYEAVAISEDEGVQALADARRFVEAVVEMLGQ